MTYETKNSSFTERDFRTVNTESLSKIEGHSSSDEDVSRPWIEFCIEIQDRKE